MSTLQSLGKLHARALALLAGVFVAGVVAGLGIGRLLPSRPHHHPPPMAFYEELGLTPEQHARVEAIFERHRGELDALLGETMPRVRAVQAVIDREIRAELTPAQARKLDELEARRPRHGPGGRLFGGPPGAGRPPGAPGTGPAPGTQGPLPPADPGAAPPGPGPTGGL